MSLSWRLWALLLGGAVLPATAASPEELLPVDQAFVLSATAAERETVDVHWQIAPGYYLYRHRIKVVAPDSFQAGGLQLPAGKPHVDTFFGPVETYRRQLTAHLPGQPGPAVSQLALEVHYQGCADMGVCYPPQKRTLTVHLPAAAQTPPLPRSSGLSLPGLTPTAGSLRLPGAERALPLPAEQAFQVEARADGGNALVLRFIPAPGYYLYRDRSAFAIEGLGGVKAGTAQWPAGTAHRDDYFGDTVVYFGPVQVRLPLQRTATDRGTATLVATFQGCQSEGICYPPMTRRLRVDIPTGKVQPAPAAAGTVAAAGSEAGNAPRVVTPEAAPNKSLALDQELPAPPGSLLLRERPPVAGNDSAAATGSDDNARRSRPPADNDSAPSGGLWLALLLALAGGAILNLMPCVLPVLSLKVLGLVQSGESRDRARAHALWYTAGVLVAFAAIGTVVMALRAAGQAAGWGFQLQQPVFVATLVYLMFAMGLSLSGVFTLGGGSRLGSLPGQRSGPLADFLTGVLACVVASPCIAPFMGGALAWAVTAPAWQGMLVFLMLGLGLALPFLLVGFIPALADRLPRPGAWMETLKQLLAFPMYLTAIWLAWILGKQRGVDGMALLLAGLAVLALGLWWSERSRWRGRALTRALAAAVVLASLLPVVAIGRLPTPATPVIHSKVNAVAYDAALLDRLRADNRVVFVNMTADWCVTCKANERNVIERSAFADLLKRTDAVYLRGDWTNVDPAISDFLAEHKAVGVPLYVVYGPGAPPTVLPVVLTQAVVEDALLRASR